MNILVIDFKNSFSNYIKESWSKDLGNLIVSDNPQDSIQIIANEKQKINFVFLSETHLTIDNLDTIHFIKEHHPESEIYVLTDKENVSNAENTLNKGAKAYFVLPVNTQTLEKVVEKSINHSSLLEDYSIIEDVWVQDLLGNTPTMQKIVSTIKKVAKTNSTILLEGETGTGKEFIAKMIHRISPRKKEPFIAINCGAIPENLIESELFGAKKGAFTGATQDRIGLIEKADQGTLFLDEIGDLPLNLQVKLLRFLQEKEIRQVGDTESRLVNVRILSATNVNLKKAIKDGTFREDLFYRLNIFNFNIPPLRERKQALPHLILFFVKKYSQEKSFEIKGIANEVQNILQRYDYPGNIRELENIIEHSVVLCDNEYILKEHLPEPLVQDSQTLTQLTSSLSTATKEEINQSLPTLQEIEKEYIQKIISQTKSQQKAAKILGISRTTLWRKLKEHNLT